jgi:hypothetical protein
MIVPVSAVAIEASEFRSFDFQQEDREPDQARIEAARTEWRATPRGKGNDINE